MTPYEQAELALDELIRWVDDNAADSSMNEASTRFKIIDRLLYEVLAWPRHEIDCEHSQDGEYLDYRIGKPEGRMVLEAKKEGIHFSIPAGTKASVLRLRTLTQGKEGENLRKAVDQVSQYCARSAISLAAVCNGHQLIVFLGARIDGVPPMNGVALVYPDLASMRNNFRQLWENVSKYGVEKRTIFLTLREGERPTPPEPLATHISGYPRNKKRNELQNELELLADLFLDDAATHDVLKEKFLTDTYASSGALNNYALISRKILESRYSTLHDHESDYPTAPATGKKGLNPKLADEILASGLSKRPIILLGDVGVGKTMFIQRLINVDAKEIFSEAISIYVDFGRQATSLSELDDFVVDETERQLLNMYNIDIQERKFVEAVHHGQLNRFERGIHGWLKDEDPTEFRRKKVEFLERLMDNRREHLKACLNHIRGSLSKQIVIFLDNIDQREIEFQEHVFILSESMASSWPVTVFVALRPDTFHHSRQEGTLAAYRTRVFTISPPQVEVVLRKRFDFALEQLREPSMNARLQPGIRMESEVLELYFEMLSDNFATNRNLIELVSNLADGNVRQALNFVSSFIGSGHVETSKIIEILRESGKYTLPIHEFLRAIIYGSNEFFEPDSSPLANLFDISQPDGREHFLSALLISHIQATGARQSATDGFIELDTVYSFAQGLGFDVEQIAWAIERMSKKGLLERSSRANKAKSSLSSHIRVTASGAYTIKILIGLFVYMDAVVVDTPIVDSTPRSLINDAKSIHDRLRRAEVFRSYLDRHWRAFEDTEVASLFDWRTHSKNLADQVIDITYRADHPKFTRQ